MRKQFTENYEKNITHLLFKQKNEKENLYIYKYEGILW